MHFTSIILPLLSLTVTTLANDYNHVVIGRIHPQNADRVLLLIFDRYILVFKEGLKLTPAPHSDNSPVMVAPLSLSGPALGLRPSRQPSRRPILGPPPPPLHLAAATLIPFHEENELAGPPELNPVPPRPPPRPSASSSLTAIIADEPPGLMLPPPPRKDSQSQLISEIIKNIIISY